MITYYINDLTLYGFTSVHSILGSIFEMMSKHSIPTFYAIIKYCQKIPSAVISVPTENYRLCATEMNSRSNMLYYSPIFSYLIFSNTFKLIIYC